MKRKTIFLLFVTALGLAITFNACKKDDTTAPVITLNGNSVMSVNYKTTFTDPGASAVDDEDGTVTVYVSGTVNTQLADTYTLTYTAEDEAGNVTEVTRTVHVYIKGSNMASAYAVTDSIPGYVGNYQDNITASTLDTNKVFVTRFANYDNGGVNFVISGVNGRTVTIPQQTVTCGDPAADRTFTGTGTISADGNTILLNYTEVTNATSVTGVEKYVRQ